MACLQLLKSSPQAKFGCFCSDSRRVSVRRRLVRVQNSGMVPDGWRLRVSCIGESGDDESNREEPPESLFTKELRRRGMRPDSMAKDKNRSTGTKEEVKYREEDGGWSYSRRNGVTTDGKSDMPNQREQSMALNSEGLEGLIPRAKALLTLGGTFFLAFWPLILVTVASFAALYLYFGPEFVHDGNSTPPAPPQHIDPYDLLEEERIYNTAPPIN